MSLLKRLLGATPFVSDADQLLERFNANNPRSQSQLAEAKKHRRIFLLRDHSQPQKPSVP